MPAKYHICRRIPTEIDLLKASEEELWAEHDRLTGEFLEVWEAIRYGEMRIGDMPKADNSFLDLKVELARRMLRHCNFCRWNCRVDRASPGKRGTCQLETMSKVGSYFHHRGEELVFQGTNGSGTIFFTSCNMRCTFCQNGDISHDKDNGLSVTAQQLASMAWQLRMEGVHNINFVGGEPTIHLHNIVEAVSLLDSQRPTARDLGYVGQAKADYFSRGQNEEKGSYYDGEFNVPILWNSNFYMSDETMQILRTLMDVWLPDFKFGNDKCAVFLSKTPWYFETVSRNHKMVYDWGEDMVIRHLVMPGHVECCTKPVLEWIAINTPNALLNVMDQFYPQYACDPLSPQFEERYSQIARHPTDDEIRRAYRYAKDLGLCFEPLSYESQRGLAV